MRLPPRFLALTAGDGHRHGARGRRRSEKAPTCPAGKLGGLGVQRQVGRGSRPRPGEVLGRAQGTGAGDLLVTKLTFLERETEGLKANWGGYEVPSQITH